MRSDGTGWQLIVDEEAPQRLAERRQRLLERAGDRIPCSICSGAGSSAWAASAATVGVRGHPREASIEPTLSRTPRRAVGSGDTLASSIRRG
jgi:hypothetical protein